jgi:hypothetical protein
MPLELLMLKLMSPKTMMNKPMKHHLLLCLTILPLWTASAAILSLKQKLTKI